MKKTLSIILSFIMVFGIFGLNAFAAAETATDVPSDTVIKEIDLTFDFDIGGKNVLDYEDYTTINTPGIEFEDNYDGIGVVAVPIEGVETEKFIEGEVYNVSFYLTPKEGYVLPLGEDVKAVVNGEEYDCETYVSEQYDEEAEDYVEVPTCHIYIAVVIGPKGGFAYGKTSKLIKEISIDIAPVAGMTVADWEEYIKINTPNLGFDDENGYPGAFVYNEDFAQLPNDYIFVAGERYYIEAQLKPEMGYCFPFNGLDKVTVNGEETIDYYVDSYYNDDYIFIDFVSVSGSEVATGENTFFDSTSNYFTLLFARIENYFVTMIQKILLLFIIL